MVHGGKASDTRKPYSGLSRSLVIAIDVGTTFSGVRSDLTKQFNLIKILFRYHMLFSNQAKYLRFMV